MWLNICKKWSLSMRLISRFFVLAAAALLAFGCPQASAQSKGYDVFVPISKYMASGDAESLSAWFADNLDMQVISRERNVTKAQARQILKSFFSSYTPRSFEIGHTAGKGGKKYAFGTLNAGGDRFDVTIFVAAKDEKFLIEQLKVEKTE